MHNRRWASVLVVMLLGALAVMAWVLWRNNQRAEKRFNVMAGKGKYSGALPLALDTKPGTWRLIATEVISGKKEKADLKSGKLSVFQNNHYD